MAESQGGIMVHAWFQAAVVKPEGGPVEASTGGHRSGATAHPRDFADLPKS